MFSHGPMNSIGLYNDLLQNKPQAMICVIATFADACMCDMASVCWSVSFLCVFSRVYVYLDTFLIARFMGPIWGRQDPGGPHVGPMNFAIWNMTTQGFPIIMSPASTKLKGVYTGFTLSRVCPSVRLWTESCPLCIFNNTRRIYLIFAHLIKQLQKICRV